MVKVLLFRTLSCRFEPCFIYFGLGNRVVSTAFTLGVCIKAKYTNPHPVNESNHHIMEINRKKFNTIQKF